VDLKAFAAAFAAIALAELGDKTQLLALALAARSGALTAFAAATLGFVAANLLTLPLGAVMYCLLSPAALRAAAGALLVAAGALSLLGRGERAAGGCGLLRGFCLVFLAELGDKTNLATLAAAAGTGALAEVALAVVSVALVMMALAAALGSALAARLPERAAARVSGALFVAIGAALALSALLEAPGCPLNAPWAR